MITQKLESIQEILQFLCSCSNSFVYRGHASAKWKLESSLTRASLVKDAQTLNELEDFSILEFKSKFSIYKGVNEKPSTDLGWLSMMQHFGSPTRLIDFTTSPYVALHFILESFNPSFYDHDDSFCLIAFNYSKLNEKLLSKINTNANGTIYNLESLYKDSESIFDKFFKNNNNEMPLFMVNEPMSSNVRLDRQRGTFLISSYCDDIIAELSKVEYNDIMFSKTLIPYELYQDIYRLLRQMNISTKVIYGDLEGLGKSLKADIFYQSLNRKIANESLIDD